MVRPKPKGQSSYPYMIFDHYNSDDDRVIDFKNSFQEEKTISPLILKPFKNYMEWLKRTIIPQFENTEHIVNFSRFPGDFYMVLQFKGKTPLKIVGLNSTWIQYTEALGKGKLELPKEQLLLTLPETSDVPKLEIFEDGKPALLLMHHPPDWLSPYSQKVFNEGIYTPNRFRACLSGHIHEGLSTSNSVFGGRYRNYFQTYALFGFENKQSTAISEQTGYSLGSISEDGEIRVWPFQRISREGGEASFDLDLRFEDETDDEGVQLCPPATGNSAKRTTKKTALKSKKRKDGKKGARAKTKDDVATYLKVIIDDTSHINISGIGSGAGTVSTATRYAIEKLYVPLSSPSLHNRIGLLENHSCTTNKKRKSKSAKKIQKVEKLKAEELMMSHEAIEHRVVLQALLEHYDRLLIEGQPGSGKTTFLRFMTCMLARDCLGIQCPDGKTWRERYLGMDSNVPALIPVFIRISLLLDFMETNKSKSLRRDDRLWIPKLLAEYSRENDIAMSVTGWCKLIECGKTILLLDGLDEVVDLDIRNRVFSIFRDACVKWLNTRIVVTSRPIQTQALMEMDFGRGVIEPFGVKQVRTFIQQWVAALHKEAPDQSLSSVAARYHELLLEAILDNHRIRLLAENPVMLISLCVVHWNDGNLPEGRSRVYKAVVRWLIASRKKQREAGFSDHFALKGFARISLNMMCAQGGKRSIIDLEEGARLVEPIVKRDFPQLKSLEERWALGRKWLRFECLGSNVVEELSKNRIRFWHLTFQEYLAAQQLAWLGDGISKTKGKKKTDFGAYWWPVIDPFLEQAQWRETLELLPGCLIDEGGETRVDHLLRYVLKKRGSKPSLATEARVVGIMNRLLQPMKIYNYNPPSDVRTPYDKARKRAMEIFTVKGSKKVPIIIRIEVAEALGQGGDPRLRPGKIQYLEIPGMKGKKLGKHPVTVEEYQRFLDARGYDKRKYWDDVGWSINMECGWKSPGKWEDQIKNPNRPVIQISWYEAYAYCKWLSEVQDRKMRLPSESEWQAAAKPDKGKYPWGSEEPDEELANFNRNVGSPTPVGVYTRGVGTGGHLDLAGNVLEWCDDKVDWTSWMDDYLTRIKSKRYEGETARALRGGGFWYSAVFLRFSARFWNPAGHRFGFFGFRVLSAPASTVNG